jgi:hypothetical protein
MFHNSTCQGSLLRLRQNELPYLSYRSQYTRHSYESNMIDRRKTQRPPIRRRLKKRARNHAKTVKLSLKSLLTNYLSYRGL